MTVSATAVRFRLGLVRESNPGIRCLNLAISLIFSPVLAAPGPIVVFGAKLFVTGVGGSLLTV